MWPVCKKEYKWLHFISERREKPTTIHKADTLVSVSPGICVCCVACSLFCLCAEARERIKRRTLISCYFSIRDEHSKDLPFPSFYQRFTFIRYDIVCVSSVCFVRRQPAASSQQPSTLYSHASASIYYWWKLVVAGDTVIAPNAECMPPMALMSPYAY